MNYLTIDTMPRYGYKLSATYKGKKYPVHIFCEYTLQQAIREYRRKYGLVGKHLVQIDLR